MLTAAGLENVGMATQLHSEESIIQTIDLYWALLKGNQGFKRWRRRPYRVEINEFFQFTPASLSMIERHRIQGLQGVRSWFEICLKGQAEIDRRFP